MTPERWLRIEKLFNNALDLEAGERREYLSRACEGDSDLLHELEALLAADSKSQNLLSCLATITESENQPIATALREHAEEISHYRIHSRIGAGGMGEVWLAEDLRLGRRVALKMLPRRFVQDAELLSRFKREARAASLLNHPNIITIYEIGQIGRTHFIATEFIEGLTLRDRIRQGPLEMAEALNLATQIASAIDTAHKAGIIHRDIKPENIMIRPDGLAKVLDFGLARIAPAGGKETSDQDGPKEHVLSTAQGALIGTPRYMAPEQVRGQRVDQRADIFSLGVVIYEMVTGNPPFYGQTMAEQIAAILEREAPPLSDFRADIPPGLETIVAKSLARDADARYQSMEGLLGDLLQIQDVRFSQGGAVTRRYSGVSDPGSKKSGHIDGNPALVLIRRLFEQAAIPFAILGLVVAAYLAAGYLRGYWPFVSTVRPPLPDAQPWYEIGTQAIRDGAYDQAKEFLEQAVRKDPSFALARARLAESLSEQDYNEEAQQQLLQVYSLIPDRTKLPAPERLNLEAIIFSVGRNYAKAAECYTEMIAVSPKSERSRILLDLGLALEKNFETAGAIESYRKALDADQRSAAAHLRLGIVYGEREKDLARSDAAFDEAENLYRQAGNKEGLAAVYFNRGMINDALSRLDAGRKQLQLAVESDSRYLATRALLHLSGNSLAAGRVEQSIQEVDRGLEQARRNNMRSVYTLGLINKAGIYHDTGAYSEAEKFYLQAIESARSYNGRYYLNLAQLNLGSLKVQLGRLDEGLLDVEPACAFFESANYRNEQLRALLVLARAKRLKQDYAGAKISYDTLMPLAERSGDRQVVALVHSELSQLYIFQERYPEALPHIDESYRIYLELGINLRLPYALMRRARVKWQLGDYNAASAALTEALSRKGSSRDVADERAILEAEILLSRNDPAGAIRKCRTLTGQFGSDNPELRISAIRISCQALAFWGSPARGRPLCVKSIDEARNVGKQRSLADGMLALSGVEYLLGNWKASLTAATEAQNLYAGQERPESEWRAWLAIARSSQSLQDNALATQAADNANNKLRLLKKSWGDDDYNRYLSRPDIGRQVASLDGLGSRK